MRIHDDVAAEVPVRVYRPHGLSSEIGLLWLHGGGLVIGQPSQDDALCSLYARELGITVISVDYRLAPEQPFPAALDDSHVVWQWVQAALTGTPA